MITWAVANQKGGVGKTTTALALGALLAARGNRVLLIDLDPHASLTRSFGISANPAPAGCAQLFDDPPATLSELELRPGPERLGLIAGQPALATIEKRSATRPGLGLAVKQALESSRDNYDFSLLDCPPTLGVLMVNALAAADMLVIPTQTDPLALHGAESMVRTAAMIARSRGRGLPISILPTLHDKRTRSGMETLANLRNHHGDMVWDELIPLDTRLRDSGHILSAQESERSGRGLAAYFRALEWLLARPMQE